MTLSIQGAQIEGASQKAALTEVILYTLSRLCLFFQANIMFLLKLSPTNFNFCWIQM